MSDSSKLRFVYGVLFLIGAFILFGVDISVIFLLIFFNIPENCITTIVLMVVVSFAITVAVLIPNAILSFLKSGIIHGKEQK